MLRHYCLVICLFAEFLAFSNTVFAQSINSGFSEMFNSIDSSKVSTGFLLDKAIEYVELHDYDGVLRNNNYSDAAVFRNTLATINSARINSNGQSYDVDYLTNSLVDSTAVTLGIAAFKYNQIVSNALSDNLISFEGGRVYDVYENGIWQNPYSENRVFVFTPSLPGFIGTGVRFKYSATHFIGNLNPSMIEFDAGDGVGYRIINGSFDSVIIYPSTGEKTLKMRITLSDSSVMEGQCKFDVLSQPVTPSSATQPSSSVIKFLSTDLSVSARVSYVSAHSGAIVKPFIYVEGFDNGLFGLVSNIGAIIDTLKLKHGIISMLKDVDFDPVTNQLTLKSRGAFDFNWFYDSALVNNTSIKDEYDVFYVDWFNPSADIHKNAALLIEIINWINDDLKSEDAERNIIVGHSMGGLIARYALSSMEQAETEHKTDVYVSLDAPHLGVNFPIGFQFALRELHHILYGSIHAPGLLTYHLADPLVSYLFNVYNSSSAKQMMYYFVEEDNQLTTDYYDSWQLDYNTKGFPIGDTGHPIQNLSIVNGGEETTNPSLLDFSVSFGPPVISNGSWLKLLLMILTRTSNLNLSFEISRYRDPDDDVLKAKAYYTKQWPWRDTLEYKSLLSNDDTLLVIKAPANNLGLDNVYASTLMENSKAGTIGPIQYNYNAPILFVPQASALAIKNITVSDYQYNYYAYPPIPKEKTPFDSYFLFWNAQSHAHHSSRFWDWIIAQKNLDLTGPDGLVLTGDSYSVTGVPSDYNSPDWSLSGPNISVTNGTVTVVSQGTMSTVMYKNMYGGAFLYKQKRVLAGFPAMSLSGERDSGSQYTVTASCVSMNSELRAKVQELRSSGDLKYIWGYKNSNNSYNWIDTTSVNHHTFTAPVGTTTHVCMKLYNGPGREGPVTVYDIVRQSDIRYYTDPQEILVNSYGYTMNYQYVNGLSTSKYLAIWCNPDYTGGNVIIPDSVEVGGVYYPVATTLYQTINGDPVTIYCFDIKDNPSLQNTISEVRDGNTVPHIVFGAAIRIRSNGSTVESFVLPIVSRTIPGPFDPILL